MTDVIMSTMHHMIFTDEEMLKRLNGAPGFGSFRALQHFKKLIAKREVELIRSARSNGFSWYHLGLLLGTSRQAVHQRWKRLEAKGLVED